VLALGAGGGHLLSHLSGLELTSVDLSPAMLGASRLLNPAVRHLEGDMRSVRLEETFDAVLLPDSVAYLVSDEDVARALFTAVCHLDPGGLVLVQPDYVQESFPGDHTAHHSGGPGVDVLEWCRQVGPCALETSYVFLFADRCERDVHRMGIFPCDFWLEKLKAAGFRATCSQSGGPRGQGVYAFSGRLMNERGKL
jgi:SAM-dependent methyltransferase